MKDLAKNLNLTQEAYDTLIVAMRRGDNTLFKSIFVTYSKDCISFLKQQYNIDHNTAYDVTLDAIVAMRQRMVDGKVAYGNIKFLFLQMAKHIYLKSIRKGQTVALDFDLELEDDETTYAEDELKTLSQALNSMQEECKQILIMFYYNSAKLYDIADMMNKSHDAIRKQKERCKNHLIEVFNKMVNGE